MSKITANLHKIEEGIQQSLSVSGRKREEITLVAISKNVPLEKIEEAYRAGQRDFGESRVQEAHIKMQKAPADIRWHFVGRLQKNKVSKVVGHFTLIHSVDTLELAQKIGEVSVQRGVTSRVLLEVNTSKEASKAGFTPQEWRERFSQFIDIPGLDIQGLMTIGPHTSEESSIREAFAELKELQHYLKSRTPLSWEILSMGMSSDYPLAIEEGATVLRVGSLIFT